MALASVTDANAGMNARSSFRGYEIRYRTVRDGEGQLASCEALDDETVHRDLDAFIRELEAPQLSRQPKAVTQFGDNKWCASRDGHTRGRWRGKGRNLNPSYA